MKAETGLVFACGIAVIGGAIRLVAERGWEARNDRTATAAPSIADVMMPASRAVGPQWAVVSPRHLVTSPAPLVTWLSPGATGILLEVRTKRGAFAAPVRAASADWPAHVSPLEPGDWFWVRISAHGMAAAAAGKRVAADRARSDVAEGVRYGLPGAILLAGHSHPRHREALIRCGLPFVPRW